MEYNVFNSLSSVLFHALQTPPGTGSSRLLGSQEFCPRQEISSQNECCSCSAFRPNFQTTRPTRRSAALPSCCCVALAPVPARVPAPTTAAALAPPVLSRSTASDGVDCSCSEIDWHRNGAALRQVPTRTMHLFTFFQAAALIICWVITLSSGFGTSQFWQ